MEYVLGVKEEEGITQITQSESGSGKGLNIASATSSILLWMSSFAILLSESMTRVRVFLPTRVQFVSTFGLKRC